MSVTDLQKEVWPSLALWILRVAAISLFAARGVLYLTDQGPLSVFFWNQAWLEEGVRDFLAMDWEDYASHSEPIILYAQKSIGGLFLLCALVAGFVGPSKNRWASGIVWAGMVFLIPFWLLRWVDSN
ncbi:MAG: hypothetical protein ACQKBU_06160, partial [Verrucomicrobiales bacterium]